MINLSLGSGVILTTCMSVILSKTGRDEFWGRITEAARLALACDRIAVLKNTDTANIVNAIFNSCEEYSHPELSPLGLALYVLEQVEAKEKES